MLAPGQEVKVNAEFTYNDPNIYDVHDVETFFEVAYNAGVFRVPVHCYKRRSQIQVFGNFEDGKKAYQELRDPQRSRALSSDQISREIKVKLDALVAGKADAQLAITNTGFEAARIRIKLAEFEVDGACVRAESEASLKTAEEACQAHESVVEARAAEIKAQWSQWTELKR